MNANAEEVEADSEEAGNGSNQSLEQIREILFGSQTRDIDVRLQQMHDQFYDAIGNLRALITERSDTLHGKLEQEMRKCHEKLNEYQRESNNRVQDLDGRFNNTTNELRQQVGALGETLKETEQSVRTDMNSGFEELKDNFSAQLDQIREQIKHDIARLTTATVSRRSLSDALRQLSSQFEED